MASMPRRDRGERDDARSGGNYRVALSGSFWPEAALRDRLLSADCVEKVGHGLRIRKVCVRD